MAPSGPPLAAFAGNRRSDRGGDTSKLPSSSAPPPGKVPLADPSLKDEEGIRTVQKCVADKARTPSANEIQADQRPILEEFIDAQVRDHFVTNIRQIDASISASKIQSLLQVLGASGLLEAVDFNRVESLYLPKTSQRAMVVKLSHIARFEEKPAFLGKANYSYAMIHGTNLIGAKYCLAEALARPADCSYCEILSKCEQPTYGCFALGSCVTSREGEIPNWNLVDLLDRATTKGKGQQEILLALQYKGAKEHLALKAGGNDMMQVQCALTGVVTTSEKYTVARSELYYSKPYCGCDPLALPVAALLYQQADNFWLRKLAHVREFYLIPTGDIAAVVFGTELLSRLRARGIDLDRVSQCRARQDGQTLDKINNKKYAAKVVAEDIQQWVPMKATDPSSQHTITQLQQQAAELKQRLGDAPDTAPPESSTPPPSTSSPSAPAPHPTTPIARALQGNAATPPPAFEPASLLVTPVTTNAWLLEHPITSLAVRTFNQWLRDLNLPPAQRATVDRNLAKVEEWWNAQPDSAVDTIQRTAFMMGLPVSIFKGNFNDTTLVKILTVAVTMSC
eukprot:s3879_g2.t1